VSIAHASGLHDTSRAYLPIQRTPLMGRPEQNVRPITRAGDAVAGIPEVPIGDARDREQTTVRYGSPRVKNCRSVRVEELRIGRCKAVRSFAHG
jgi:hypothetical protein